MNKLFSRALTTKILCCLVIRLLPFSALAQENSEAADDIERIEVQGQSPDVAMRAFNAGDFALAEVEFKLNAKCALRIERSQLALAEGLQNAGIDQNLAGAVGAGAAVTAGGGNASSNNVVTPNVTSSNNLGGRSANSSEKPAQRKRTCENRGFQLYMAGLSQLQLGKTEDAEKNFKTAVFLDENIYDAYFRLGLIQILNKNKKGAKRNIKKIERILKKCEDCKNKDEMIAQIDYLKKAITE